MSSDSDRLAAIADKFRSRVTPAPIENKNGSISSIAISRSSKPTETKTTPALTEVPQYQPASAAEKGPLLRGTPAQLEEARRALKTYSHGPQHRVKSAGPPPQAMSSMHGSSPGRPKLAAKSPRRGLTSAGPKQEKDFNDGPEPLKPVEQTSQRSDQSRAKVTRPQSGMSDAVFEESSRTFQGSPNNPEPSTTPHRATYPTPEIAVLATLKSKVATLQDQATEVATLKSKVATLQDQATEVAKLKRQVAKLQDRVTEVATLKSKDAKLQDQVTSLGRELLKMNLCFETVIQAEEKRQFFGTDDARTPFEVTVVHGKGRFQVQANATLKIADFIRRIRIARNIMPTKSVNPRIMFGGCKIGHGMTLGEVGISSGAQVEFIHDNDGADEEEL